MMTFDNIKYAPLTQLDSEYEISNFGVAGSSPARGTITIYEVKI